ncbi:RNA polymerase sigma factor [Pedobacter sp. PAMC26386]|nr:RNA polymerase sigma factor [Pedobacter sp. PAMC26386]
MDIHAFSSLYLHYSSALLRIILKIVKSRESAEDVLQETFIKISSRIYLYDKTKGRLFTWMASIAKNMAIDHVKNRKSINSCKNISIDEIMNLPEAFNIFDYNPDVIGLLQLTQNLLPEQEKVLDLIYFKGHTHSEVAKILNIPLGTVKTRNRISISILRKYFNEFKFRND